MVLLLYIFYMGYVYYFIFKKYLELINDFSKVLVYKIRLVVILYINDRLKKIREIIKVWIVIFIK